MADIMSMSMYPQAELTVFLPSSGQAELTVVLPSSTQDPVIVDDKPVPPPGIIIPDGGLRAWLTTIGGFCICVTTFGYSNSFGVYEDYYVSSGASSSFNISWIGSIQLFLMFAVGLPAGKLFDLGYFHETVGFGSLLYVFSMFMLSLAHPSKYYQLILSQGVGMGIGSGLMLVPAMSVQAHHWKKRRALAMGIVMTGSGIGGVIFPIMINQLFNGSAGFAWGVRATAFLSLGLLVFANLVMTTRLPSAKNRPPGPKPNIKSILTDVPYLTVVAGAFFILWGLFLPYFYLQLWSTLHNLSPTLSFYTIAIMNAGSIFGRTLPNLIADYIGSFNVFLPVSLICGGLIFAMFGVTSNGAGIVFSILYGFFSGASIAVLPPVAASLSKSVDEVGLRLGLAYFIVSFSMLTGTPIVGALYDDGYQWYRPLVFSGVAIMVGSVLVWAARFMIVRRKGTQFV